MHKGGFFGWTFAEFVKKTILTLKVIGNHLMQGHFFRGNSESSLFSTEFGMEYPVQFTLRNPLP